MPGAPSIPPGPASAAGAAYREQAPPPALAPHVECFWSRTADAAQTDSARSHRVIPDGCMDIVLSFAGPSPGADGRATPVGALAVGAMTRAAVFTDSPGTSYLGVRFRPGVAGALFGVPASEMTDKDVGLAEVWPGTNALRDALAAAPDEASRVRTLSAVVARRLLRAARAPRVVSAAADRIASARGDVSIGALARDLGVTRQYLARSFAEHVGLSPKTLARVVRARSVVQAARRGITVDWTTLALEAGYYDQSHLIAELKELTGLAPTAWAAERS